MSKGTVPGVSVVMPAYNAEKYLREAIDSILAQTYTDFELIIVNDGSTDSTKKIIQSYTDSRIRYIENEQNSGICVTLNKGLDAARGRYIVRMDSDDIAMPERLSTQIAYMDTHPNIGASGCDIEVFGEDINSYVFEQLHSSDDCVAGLLFNPCVAHPSVIIRKSVLSEHSIVYEDKFRGLEDFKMWWEIAKYSQLCNLNKTLLKYRFHKGQETRNVKYSTIVSSNCFRALRYEAFGVSLSNEEKEIVNNYSLGEYQQFGKSEFIIFLRILSRVCKINNLPIVTTHKALQTVCGKAIAYTINQSEQLKPHSISLLTKAFLKGVLSPMWYFKYLRGALR